MFGLKGGLVYKAGLKYIDIFPVLFGMLTLPVFKTPSKTEEAEENNNSAVNSEQMEEELVSSTEDGAIGGVENLGKNNDLPDGWELIEFE